MTLSNFSVRALPKPIRDIAWSAQLRLRPGYRRPAASGKPKNVVTVAIARDGRLHLSHRYRLQAAHRARLTDEHKGAIARGINSLPQSRCAPPRAEAGWVILDVILRPDVPISRLSRHPGSTSRNFRRHMGGGATGFGRLTAARRCRRAPRRPRRSASSHHDPFAELDAVRSEKLTMTCE